MPVRWLLVVLACLIWPVPSRPGPALAHGAGLVSGPRAPVVRIDARGPAPDSGVVTNCRDAAATGAQGMGLSLALRLSPLVSFRCDPALSGGPGPFTIVISDTIVIRAPTIIDGSDGGQDDVTLSGGDQRQILLILPAGALRLTHITLANGAASDGLASGGAIEADGNLAVIDSTFRANRAGRLGGAIDIGSNRPASGPTVVVSGSTFVDNAALAYGGAIEADANRAVVQVTNSTFVRNTAGGAGGAIRNALATMIIVNSTFDGNAAGYGAALSNSAALTIRNSILDSNAGSCSGFVPIGDGGYNIEYPPPPFADCGFSAARGDLFADPRLGPLADNGGATQTELPGPSSPAIGTGSPTGCRDVAGHLLRTDQRGVVRTGGGPHRCTIGSVEAQA